MIAPDGPAGRGCGHDGRPGVASEGGAVARSGFKTDIRSFTRVQCRPSLRYLDGLLGRASVRRPSMTVVMPVYNREAWVGQALESVLAQTWSDFEIVVVDDGSTDGTADVLRRYLPQITLLSSPHAGAYAARNLAIHQSRGALVAFIDSDDVWHPDRLECQVPLLDDPEVGLVFGDASLVDYRRAPARRLRRTFFDGAPPFRGRGGSGFTRDNFIPLSSVLVRRQCFETCGQFAPVRVGADYLKWFEIAHRHALDYVSRPVCDYAIHPGSLTYDTASAIAARLALFSDAVASAADPGTRDRAPAHRPEPSMAPRHRPPSLGVPTDARPRRSIEGRPHGDALLLVAQLRETGAHQAASPPGGRGRRGGPLPRAEGTLIPSIGPPVAFDRRPLASTSGGFS